LLPHREAIGAAWLLGVAEASAQERIRSGSEARLPNFEMTSVSRLAGDLLICGLAWERVGI